MLAALPGHTEGLDDMRHCQLVDNHARQRPAHRRPRELRAQSGRLAHILTPHVSALLGPVAAHATCKIVGRHP